MRFLSFIINTNIFIALAAVSFSIETQVLLGLKPQLHPYLFIIFFATLFEYNLHRLITVITNPEALNDAKHSWVKEHIAAFYILVAFSVAGFFAAVLLAKRIVLLTLLPIGVVTLFYSFPIFRIGRKLMRLREITGLKLFLIAFVWSASTILLPLIQSEQIQFNRDVFILLVERFLFVVAITVPFDIRDMQADREAGLKTIPLLIGERRSLIAAVLLLSAFMLLCIWHYEQTGQHFAVAALLLSGFSTLLFILSPRIRRMKYYHYFVLDGTMLLQGLFVLLCFHFK